MGCGKVKIKKGGKKGKRTVKITKKKAPSSYPMKRKAKKQKYA